MDVCGKRDLSNAYVVYVNFDVPDEPPKSMPLSEWLRKIVLVEENEDAGTKEVTVSALMQITAEEAMHR